LSQFVEELIRPLLIWKGEHHLKFPLLEHAVFPAVKFLEELVRRPVMSQYRDHVLSDLWVSLEFRWSAEATSRVGAWSSLVAEHEPARTRGVLPPHTASEV
jgi:hypothetical protein